MDQPRPPNRPVRRARISKAHPENTVSVCSRRKRRLPNTSVSRSTRRSTALPTPEPSTLSTTKDTQSVHKTSCDQTFPFMKLPSELRIHVYRMALQRDTPLLLHLPRPTTEIDDAEGKMLESYITDKFPHGRHNMAGEESVCPALLRLDRVIYQEARQILYGDNTFVLSLTSGTHTLSNLHQRSRSLIKSVSLTIPNHHDILDNFADLVRLGLRYCWGLKSLAIVLPMQIPDGGYMHSATSIYSNAFHILRWLPKGGKVLLEGSGVSDSIKRVVEEEGRLMASLDENSYQKRQHQMPGRH